MNMTIKKALHKKAIFQNSKKSSVSQDDILKESSMNLHTDFLSQ